MAIGQEDIEVSDLSIFLQRDTTGPERVAAVGLAVLVFVLTPFVLSRAWANYVIRRMERVAKRMTE